MCSEKDRVETGKYFPFPYHLETRGERFLRSPLPTGSRVAVVKPEQENLTLLVISRVRNTDLAFVMTRYRSG